MILHVHAHHIKLWVLSRQGFLQGRPLQCWSCAACPSHKDSFGGPGGHPGAQLWLLYALVRSNPFLPEHAGLKVQGSSPMDYDMLRLFRSEASCNLLYDLLEIDPEMRPSATESLDFPWFHELVSCWNCCDFDMFSRCKCQLAKHAKAI